MWPWRVKTPTQNLLKLLVLLMLMLRVCVWSVFCCWCLIEVTKLNLGLDSEVMFGWDFEIDAWSRFWRWNMIKICAITCAMIKKIPSEMEVALRYDCWHCWHYWHWLLILLKLLTVMTLLILLTIEHSWTLLNTIECYWTLLNTIEHYWTLLNTIEHYWALVNTIEHYWTLLNTMFYRF